MLCREWLIQSPSDPQLSLLLLLNVFHFLSHKAQNRTTYYAPNQLAQMRPNPRWQQQGGRGQGESEAHDAASFCKKRKKTFYWYDEICFPSGLSSLSGGFQGMPSSLRQPGPRGNMRHMSPSGGSQGPRGVFV